MNQRPAKHFSVGQAKLCPIHVCITFSSNYTQRVSKFGNFTNTDASDLRPVKQPISEGDMGDAAGLEDEDVRAGKKPNFETHCVYIKQITLENASSFTLSFVGNHEDEHLITEWFTAYLKGEVLPFPLPLEATELGPFSKKVLQELQKIPFGKTLSYRDVAASLGNAHAARAVGNACRVNPFPFVIPCHRVIQTGGSLGGFAYGLKMKQALLNFEDQMQIL